MGSEDRQAIYGSLVIYDITKHRTGPKHGSFCDLFMQISNILQHPAGTMVVPKYIKHRLHCALENFLLQVYTGCIYLLEQNRNRDFSSNIESKSIIWLKSHIVTASRFKKIPPYGFLKFFPKRLGIFNQFFTHLLCDPFYTRLQIFIQLSPILTKLCHTKRDHLANFYISMKL